MLDILHRCKQNIDFGADNFLKIINSQSWYVFQEKQYLLQANLSKSSVVEMLSISPLNVEMQM